MNKTGSMKVSGETADAGLTVRERENCTDAPELAMDALSFEEALAMLENNVKLLEGGNLKLDEAVSIFEIGNKLQAHCEKKLSEVKLKIEKITQNAAQPGGVAFEPLDYRAHSQS
ncbi:MAG: exodeoxyribonuclease VII small subunit [Holosporales bacterium]|nr:exodeoxyribonuclease VII small subunit [Holosporales bacterium]